jgi:hypothetical protein
MVGSNFATCLSARIGRCDDLDWNTDARCRRSLIQYQKRHSSASFGIANSNKFHWQSF